MVCKSSLVELEIMLEVTIFNVNEKNKDAYK